MTRNIVLLILAFSYVSCMEMRETVERMVMVRTTNSDLQPAATGYIYKEESDGSADFVKLGESEIMKELSKLYDKPGVYAAPIKAETGAFHDSGDGGNKAASHAAYAIKPVVEKSDEGDHIGGAVYEDFGKIYADYAPSYEEYKKSFNDYVKNLDYYRHGPYYGDSGKDYGDKFYHNYGDKNYKGFKILHDYGKGDTEGYKKDDFESYGTSKDGEYKNDYDKGGSYGDFYDFGFSEKGEKGDNDKFHSKGEHIDGYHKVYERNEFKKDHDHYDSTGGKGGFHKFGIGHDHHGSDSAGGEKAGSHHSGYYGGGFGKGDFINKGFGVHGEAGHSGKGGGATFHHGFNNHGLKGDGHGGKGYDFAIKH